MKKYTAEELEIIVREVNSYDSSLIEFEYRPMCEIDETLGYESPSEILRMASFDSFNLEDDYFSIGIYGELISTSEERYESILLQGHDEIVETYNFLVENKCIEIIY